MYLARRVPAGVSSTRSIRKTLGEHISGGLIVNRVPTGSELRSTLRVVIGWCCLHGYYTTKPTESTQLFS
jgi:hypothetical protein